MPEYDDTNTFVLFTNDKGDNPKRPDRTGKVNIDGKWYKLSGWIRQGKNGAFLSGQVQPMEDNAKPAQSEDQEPPADFSDPVPF